MTARPTQLPAESALALLCDVIHFYEQAHEVILGGDEDALEALIAERDGLLAVTRRASAAGLFREPDELMTDAVLRIAALEAQFAQQLTVAVAQRGRELAQSRTRRSDADRYRG